MVIKGSTVALGSCWPLSPTKPPTPDSVAHLVQFDVKDH